MIPKIIHYCWLSGDPVPERLKNCMRSWREKLPDYEFVLWDADRFDISASEWVRQAFESKKYAFAADYIRLYAVYHCGGIYLDMDIEVLRPFDDLLDGALMLAYENDEESGIEMGCFGAEKGNPFIGECLAYYDGRPFIKDDGSFDTLPVPRIVLRYAQERQIAGIRARDFFTCKEFSTGIITTTERSHAIHHFAGSWLTTEQTMIRDMSNALYRRYGKTRRTKWLIRLHALRIRLKCGGIRAVLRYYAKRLARPDEWQG